MCAPVSIKCLKRLVHVIIIAVGVSAVLASPVEAIQTTFYVDPVNGSDTNAGSSLAPFQTIQHAQQIVRGVNAGMTGDILIWLHGGVYHLTNALSFNQTDSGTGGHQVIYAAYPGDHPVLDGGRIINGWRIAGSGVYKCAVPGIQCRQLYVNGVRAIRARWPNAGSLARIDGWDLTNQLIDLPATNFPSFASDTNNPVEIVLHLQWTAWRGRIASSSFGGSNCAVTLMAPERTTMFNQPDPGKDSDAPFFLENSLSFLDQPGEWYLDTVAGEMYYSPRASEDMATAQVVAPVLTNLVSIAGSGLDAPVHDLVFSNLIFQSTGWLAPNFYGHVDGQANQFNMTFSNNLYTTYHTPAAMMLTAAHRILITGCTFRNLGAVGIDLGGGCQTNTINGNLFEGIADNPINDAVPAVASASINDQRSVNCYNVVGNNFITGIGLDYEGAPGIFIGYAHDESIIHNEIYDVPSFGISIGWGWTFSPTVLSNNVIRNNHIMHYENSYDDGGGVYTLSSQPGTVIQSNYIHDAWYGLYAKPELPITPVYLDQGSSNIVVSDNVWTNTVGPFVNWTYGTWPQAIEIQETNGNIFFNNNADGLNIMTNAGILPQCQAIRPWPIPNHTPGNFQNAFGLGLSFAPGYNIYYTTDGSTPSSNSIRYTEPIQVAKTVRIAALAIDSNGLPSGVFQGLYRQVSQVTELMPTNTWVPIVVGNQEQVGRADDTGFPWGGYTPKPGNGSNESTLDPLCRLYFFDGQSNYTMDAPGAYVYTVFSGSGNNAPTAVVEGMNQGGAISVTVNNATPNGAFGGSLGLRFLIRDRTNNWYISAVSNALMIPGPGTFSADVTKLAWLQVNASAQTSMNGIYFGRISSGPRIITPNPSSTSPDLSQVTGGGVFVSQASGTPQTWWLKMVSWLGNNNSPPIVSTAASASPSAVTATTSYLSVLGGDTEGESNLSYQWASSGTTPTVTFSPNGSNAAKNTLAIFSNAGSYFCQVIMTNLSGLSVTSSVNVNVVQFPSTIAPTPPASIVVRNGFDLPGWRGHGSVWRSHDQSHGADLDAPKWRWGGIPWRPVCRASHQLDQCCSGYWLFTDKLACDQDRGEPFIRGEFMAAVQWKFC